jgi:8-oxo-dGTP pyrophosphatase MutT (NUDIX family)
MTPVRLLLAALYPLRRRAMTLVRWRTRGVKVMVFDGAGRVLLVRHSYGRSDLFMLPGGGIGRRESPVDAAAREIAEEVGCTLTALAPFAIYGSSAEGLRDTVHLFTARTDDAPTPGAREIIEARFVPIGTLPGTTSTATRRRIEEWQGACEPSPDW